MASLQVNIDATGAKRGASDFQQATDAIKQSATQAASASESAATAFTHQGAASRATAGEIKSQTLAQQALESSLRRIAEISAGLTIVGAFAAAAAKIKDLVTEGIRYNAVLEQQQTGIASIISATNEITTAQGRTLEGAEKFNAAQRLSSGLMKDIQKDALLTTATTEQLVVAFQSALGPLSAAGLSLDQSRQATLKIVQAASALGVPMEQVAQEVRAIAEGSIDVNARLAKALGITNQQVTAAREQGKLFEFIVEQTKAFAEAGEKTSQSFFGLSSSIADISSQIAGIVAAPFFETLKGAMASVLSVLTVVKEKLAETPDIALERALVTVAERLVETRNHIDYIRDHPLEFQGVQDQVIATTNAQLTTLEQTLKNLQVEWGLQQSAAGGAKTELDQYKVSAQQAQKALEDLQKAQEKFRSGLTNDNAALQLKIQVLEQARIKGVSYAEALKAIDTAVNVSKAGTTAEAEANAKLKETFDALLKPFQDAEKATNAHATATKKSATEAERHAEAIDKQREKLIAQTAVYQQVLKGVISLGDAEENLKIHQLAVSVGSTKLAKDFLELEKNAKAYGAATELINKLSKEKAQLDIADNKANVESLRTLQDQGLALQEEGRLLAASLGPKAAIRDIEKEIALARIERTRQTELTRAKEHELTVAEEEQIKINADLARSIALATEAEQQRKDALDASLLSTKDVSGAFKQLATGFFEGTRNLKTLVPDFFKGLAATAFSNFIDQKFTFLDKPLIDNVNGLMGPNGILSSIFQQGGSFLGQIFGQAGASAGVDFGQSAVDAANITWKSGWDLSGTGTGAASAGAQAGASWGQAFGAAGVLAVIPFLTIAAAAVGKGFAQFLGVGKTREGAKGASVVGGLFGGVFGPLGGFLFDHTPTRGQRIRSGVKEYLKDIEASFAEEIHTGDYFFKETSGLADKMFGGDFLAASKQILTDNVGPDLAKQLQALGTFITADESARLGKSTEQSGTTFGNLLIDNLGIAAIPDAIAEIVQKGGITFDGLAKKLNEVFTSGAISVEFFKDAVLGSVDLFYGDLPDAIGVSKIALKSFAEDGTFDLEKFKKAVEGATSQFDLAVQTFLDSVNNNAPGEAAAKAFGEGLKRGLDQLARDAFLQDFIENKLFAGIDFSDGLDSSEIDTLQQRTREASIQADALAKALDNTGDAVDGLSTKIRDLNAQLQDLANQRVQIQVDLAGQLGSIGALTPTQVIAAREQPLIPTVDRALNARSPIGTAPFASFSDDELKAANDALKEMGDLAVDRFNAESQAAEAALQDRIAAINTETQSTITAINQQTQATQDGIRAQFDAQQANGQRVIDGLQKQKDIQSRIFQDRIDGLQEELQAAQEFRQVSESIQQTINSLALSNSPLFKSEKLAFLQRQAGELRSDKSADAIQKLSQNLASQLQVGQDTLSPEQFAAQFTSVIDELQTLRDKTGQQGAKAEDLQRNIEALQTQQTAILERIDTQIASQQQYLQSLSQNENNAIAAAQKAGAARITAAQEAGAARIAAAQAETKAAIDAYRVVIVARLNALAAARDEILKEQAFRLKNAADLTAQELTQLIDINANTRATNDLIASFLAANTAPPITLAATGFQGIVDRPRLFLAGEAGRESVSITPVGQGQNGGGGNVTFAPSISVTMQGSSNTEQDGKRLATAISQGLLAEWRRGALGKEIRDFVKR